VLFLNVIAYVRDIKKLQDIPSLSLKIAEFWLHHWLRECIVIGLSNFKQCRKRIPIQ